MNMHFHTSKVYVCAHQHVLSLNETEKEPMKATIQNVFFNHELKPNCETQRLNSKVCATAKSWSAANEGFVKQQLCSHDDSQFC